MYVDTCLRSYLSTEINRKVRRYFVEVLRSETCATSDFCVFFTVQSGSDSKFSLIFWILGSISGTNKFLIAQLQASTENFLEVE